ncbi:uncharacterized protein F54H12.2-like [Uloborus diversus]|uniref:uncharacterized protein F54H12.2-like n=1 Tax=Uloborus diversus TaxID=327109 RepID=UPI0024097AB7|nr:uncharacterized protein F54H12.2-like [Uloborus diversus]
MSSLIHRDSPVCVKSELDLFTLPPTQAAIEKGQFVEYHPIASIRDGSPLEFSISGSGVEYTDLNASYIYVKAKIVKADGSNISPKITKPDGSEVEEVVVPTNLFLHSLFSQIDISLNERNISSASNTYPYRAYIETLLNYGEDAKKSQLTCELFYKDEQPEEIDPKAVNAGPGLKSRYELSKHSKTFDMIGQLHCDLFNQNRLLLNLVDIKIKMTRSNAAFCLLSSKVDAAYKVVLEHASLFIRKVQVSPGVSLGHAKALEKSSAKYPIDRVLCVMPKRVVIACIENAAMNGHYSKNPFLFSHHDVNFISIYVDGQPVPSKPMELDFKNNNYIRAYHSLFDGFNSDKGIYLSREQFARGTTLYNFDLSADLCNGPHLNLQHQGNLRVEIKFSTAIEETLSLLIYAEFQNVIEITKSRHVLCDFAN